MASSASTSTRAFDLGAGSSSPRRAQRGKPLLLRIVHALAESRRRQAERVIASVIARNGGKFTDTLERSIEQTTF